MRFQTKEDEEQYCRDIEMLLELLKDDEETVEDQSAE